MNVICPECRSSYDDQYRWKFCPHSTFDANDGQNNFRRHEESPLIPPPAESAEYKFAVDYMGAVTYEFNGRGRGTTLDAGGEMVSQRIVCRAAPIRGVDREAEFEVIVRRVR